MRANLAFLLVLGSLVLLSACTAPEPEAHGVSAIAYEGGPITEAEYLAIVTATHQCMVEKGYDVGPVEMRDDDLTYTFSIYGGEVGGEANGRALHACEQPFNYAEAEVAYQDQNILTGAEREQVYAEFIACLEEAGIPGVSEQDSMDEIVRRLDELGAAGGDPDPGLTCVAEYSGRIFGPYQ